MSIKFGFLKGRVYKLTQSVIPNAVMNLKGLIRYSFAPLAMMLLLINGAHGNPIIKNQVEDQNILISQFVGGQPDVLMILDLSGSMALNFGGSEIGNWDNTNVITTCEGFFLDGTSDQYIKSSHCIENAAGTDVCGFQNCVDGICSTQTELNNQLNCIQQKASSFNMCPTLQTICGGSGCTQSTQIAYALTNCNTPTKMQDAAAAVEAAAGLTQCMKATNCQLSGDTNPACNTSSDYSRFKTCMQTSQAIAANKAFACSGGTTNCTGVPQLGSSRLDMALNVIYSLLDADNSLASKSCNDPNKLYDGVSTSVNCQNWMSTPFRDVSVQVQGTGSGFKLPTSPAEGIIDELTNSDAQILGLRLRAMTYSGASWNGCTSNNTFQVAQGGFAGQSQQDLQNFWKFFRGSRSNGGTPLAYALGLDDNNGNGSGGGNVINNDTLGVYKVELQTDPAISCRPEFVIVITDGEDTCSGQCSATSSSCTGGTTTDANRRSSVQAVSNLRTYYSRNPAPNGGQTFKKEVLTFVIGIGIHDDQAKRTLNAMALAGGTSTKGVIKHTGPDGSAVGTVDINDLLPSGSSFDVFRNLAMATGIDTNPSSAQLQNCKTPNESGVCAFQSTNVFDNNFFDTGAPFTSGSPLNGFAFFANNAQELSTALQTILQFIRTFSTSGVAPTAPQSSTSVALRDRVFLSILTPITTERLWQGRLALYAFIDDPNNIGAKIIVDDTPQQNQIFNANGSLNSFAQNFYWEAGKNLAERDISSNPRNLFSVDTTDATTVDTVTSSSKVVSIRYRGERATFDKNLPFSLFGITATDVTNPIPDFCNTGGVRDCSSSCTVVTSSTCQSCVEQCIRDDIVSFMSGNTNIQPVEDPMGTIGTNCPDPQTGTGSLDTCSLRLGDIFHSTPVVVGSPSPLFFDVGFQNFAAAFQNRTGVVYVGANDGFLHGFNAGDFVNASATNPQKNPFTLKDETLPFFSAGDGTELFGFAPPTFLPDSLSPPPSAGDGSAPSGFGPPDYRFGDFETFVKDDNEPERSFFDGSPLVADVWIDGYQNGIQNNASCTSNPDIDGIIDPCGKEWHSVLLSAFRNGGGAYIALDVTNVDRTQTNLKKLSTGPDYPRHLWTLFDKNFGNAWADPTIGRVKMKTKDKNGNPVIVDRWVMFVGGGSDPTIPPENFNASTNNTVPNPQYPGVTFGNAFYVIDIATGSIIFKFAHDSTNSPNATVTDARMTCDMPSKVGAFDLNGDGYIDVAYEGDTCGRLWRFDVSQPIFDAGNDVTKTGLRGTANITAKDPTTGKSVWTGDIAFCANSSTECAKTNAVPTTNRQPIFFAPTVVLDDLGQRHVIFLTGDRRDPSLTTNSSTGTAEFGKLYNFIDTFIPAFLAGGTAVTAPMQTESNFTSGQIINIVPQSGVSNQFTTSGGSTINNQGQFIINFPANVSTPSGEKGFGSPVVVNRVLIFTTFAPNTNLTNPCSQSTGVGNIFALDYLSGQPALVRIPGAKNLIGGSSSQQNAAAGRTVAQGMPTPAQLTFGARGSVVLTVAFTGNSTTGGSQFLVWQLPPFPTRTQTLFWEQML
jgi:Tfp pilus tip-associated adhesin PilY1